MKTKANIIFATHVCPALATMALLFSAIQPASAGIGTDTWVGNNDANLGDGGANWTGVNDPPHPLDSLVFANAGSSGTSLNNTLAAGMAIDGITFDSGASAFTFSGNSLLLSGNTNANSIGIANNSSAAQTIGLPLSLDWGYYTFSNASGGSLALNGGLTLNTGGVAYFDLNNTSSALTLDGTTGLISGLEGAGLIYTPSNGATNAPSGLATISSGAISAYTYLAGETRSGGGTLANGGNNNFLLTDNQSGTITYSANGLSVNTITAAQVGSPTIGGGGATTVLAIPSSLTFANNGGIYVPDSANTSVNCLYVGEGSMTAGNGSAPANLIFCVNGNNNNGQNGATCGQLNLATTAVIDNGGGGPVTVIKTGSGAMSLGSSSDSYSGGTYVNQGMITGQHPNAFGSGPVYVAAGASVYLGATGTWANNFYLSPGPSVTNYPSVNSASGPVPNQGSLLWYSTSTLSGTLTLTGPPTLTAGQADKMSDNYSGLTLTITGQITGTGTLEIGGTYATHNPTVLLNNTANPANNWQGGLILDMNYSTGSSIYFKAGNSTSGPQMPTGANAGSVTLIPASGAECRFDLDGQSAQINGLYASSGNATVDNFGSVNATLTLGVNNATASFSGTCHDGSGNQLSLVKTGSGTQTMSGNLTLNGSVTNNQGTLVLSGADTFGAFPNGVYVNGGILDVAATGSIQNDVFVIGGTLELDNSSAIGSSAGLGIVVNPASPCVYLNYPAATPMNIPYLLFGSNASGTYLPIGSYGAIGNASATHQFACFTGTGVINVTAGGGSLPVTSTITMPASASNPSTYGSPVTFTATVNGASPTGTVTFWVNGVAASVVNLTPVNSTTSTATLTTNTLPSTVCASGNDTIYAAYSGDANNSSSDSSGSPASQTVNPLPVSFTRSYDAGTDANAATMALADIVPGDSVTVTGSGSVASDSVSATAQSITLGTLALGGANVCDYTLTGASLIITNSFPKITSTSSRLGSGPSATLQVCWQTIPGVIYHVYTNANLKIGERSLAPSWVEDTATTPPSPITGDGNVDCVTLPCASPLTNNFVLIQQTKY